jgi:hypothetical protein
MLPDQHKPYVGGPQVNAFQWYKLWFSKPAASVKNFDSRLRNSGLIQATGCPVAAPGKP